MDTYLEINANCIPESIPSHEFNVPADNSSSSPSLASAKQVATPAVVQLVGSFLLPCPSSTSEKSSAASAPAFSALAVVESESESESSSSSESAALGSLPVASSTGLGASPPLLVVLVVVLAPSPPAAGVANGVAAVSGITNSSRPGRRTAPSSSPPNTLAPPRSLLLLLLLLLLIAFAFAAKAVVLVATPAEGTTTKPSRKTTVKNEANLKFMLCCLPGFARLDSGRLYVECGRGVVLFFSEGLLDQLKRLQCFRKMLLFRRT